VTYSAPELESFTPTMRWHHRAVTEKQKDFLRRYRVDVNAIPSRGHASAIIDTILRPEFMSITRRMDYAPAISSLLPRASSNQSAWLQTASR
jgi:hypothetical protein